MHKDEFVNKLCDWYKVAYSGCNHNQLIILRNIAIIRDAFESCHAEFMDEAFDGRHWAKGDSGKEGK